MTGSLLDILLDQQLSAVVFVQDYLQLDFNGHRMTLYIWPMLSTPKGKSFFGDAAFRNELCGFIAKKVRLVELYEKESLLLYFQDTDGIIHIDLSTGSEAVYFTEYDTQNWLTL